jgi:exocyst complex protein 7
MGDCGSIQTLEDEENLIAAVQNILKAIETRKNLSNGAREILVDLGSKLSSFALIPEPEWNESNSEIEEKLNSVQNKFMNWEVDQTMIWYSGPEEATEFLNAVDEIQKLIDNLEGLNLSKDTEENSILLRAYDVLQTAMARAEEEFTHILVHSRQPFQPEHVSFRSEEDVVDQVSIVSFGDESFEDVIPRDSVSRRAEDHLITLIQQDVIPDLKCLANLMFDSNYGRECSQSYISARKDALDDCLFILEVEKSSIEDVLKMEWSTLNSKIRRWIWAIKIFVRVYLASEKSLCDQIFGDLDSISPLCFAEASKSSILQLLNFGEAIAIGPHPPEKLLRILDMYEVLADLIPDIDALFTDEAGASVRFESQDVLRRLGDCVKATFLKFKSAVASNVSVNPFAGGGVHHLTRYVMNYLKTLTVYNNTLDVLLMDHEPDDSLVLEPDMSPIAESDDSSGDVSISYSPTALHFRSLASILEHNLADKAKLYKEDSLRHLFLMNNIHYMAEKVKASSELRMIFGDGWIRKHNGRFQKLAMSYERATWSTILSLLKDEGIHNPGSNSVSKTLLREKLQKFYVAFEEVYKNQTAWLVADSQLREDLRISTSMMVIQAYRTFVGRHSGNVSERHIKYSADELEHLLLDFFEGSPRSLHSFHRK